MDIIIGQTIKKETFNKVVIVLFSPFVDRNLVLTKQFAQLSEAVSRL